MKMTYQIAMAAGQDAGNNKMLELSTWDKSCLQAATTEFNRLVQLTHSPARREKAA